MHFLTTCLATGIKFFKTTDGRRLINQTTIRTIYLQVFSVDFFFLIALSSNFLLILCNLPPQLPMTSLITNYYSRNFWTGMESLTPLSVVFITKDNSPCYKLSTSHAFLAFLLSNTKFLRNTTQMICQKQLSDSLFHYKLKPVPFKTQLVFSRSLLSITHPSH